MMYHVVCSYFRPVTRMSRVGLTKVRLSADKRLYHLWKGKVGMAVTLVSLSILIECYSDLSSETDHSLASQSAVNTGRLLIK
jgi:hypothetical protein